MYRFKIISYFVITIALISCEFPDKEYVILLKNHSNHEISSYSSKSYGIPNYPDTTIVETNFRWSVYPGKSIDFSSTFPWEELISDGDTLSIFIFHTDTLKSNTWESIIDKYKVLKRYDLSIEDIHILDYDIPYPPSEKMRNMRMYPPYKE